MPAARFFLDVPAGPAYSCTVQPVSSDGPARALYRALRDLARSGRERESEQLCGHRITRTECHALEALVERGPMTVNGIASELRLDKSTASRVARSLVGKSLAARAGHPADGRALQIAATARGRRLHATVLAESIACYARLLEDVAPSVRTEVIRLLESLSLPDLPAAACRPS
jgi:DNA-binding MarR family transcriptional regulator